MSRAAAVAAPAEMVGGQPLIAGASAKQLKVIADERGG